MAEVKEWVRGWLPRPLWVLLRRSWSYLRGLGRWGPLFVRMRGDGAGEALKLYLSALAAPVTALPKCDAWYHPAVLFDTRVRDTWVRDGGASRFLCRGGTDDLAHALVGTGAASGGRSPGTLRRAGFSSMPVRTSAALRCPRRGWSGRGGGWSPSR